MTLAIRDHADGAALATALADRVARDLAEAIAARGRATLAVPGGTTPGRFLTALAGADLDWGKVAATLTDERWVAQHHPRSNERLLRGTLLSGRAAALNFVPLRAPEETPEETPELGLPAVTRALAESVLPLDVVVLGMGADMHVASLFPRADRLAEALDPACPAPVLPMRAPGAPELRITLTAPPLLLAKMAYILIEGPEKTEALETALAGDDVLAAPVRLMLTRDAPTEVWRAP